LSSGIRFFSVTQHTFQMAAEPRQPTRSPHRLPSRHAAQESFVYQQVGAILPHMRWLLKDTGVTT
jgi:hypothetical protein